MLLAAALGGASVPLSQSWSVRLLKRSFDARNIMVAHIARAATRSPGLTVTGRFNVRIAERSLSLVSEKVPCLRAARSKRSVHRYRPGSRIELPVVLDDLTLIGGWSPRLLIGWVRQLLLIARSEIGVRSGRRCTR